MKGGAHVDFNTDDIRSMIVFCQLMHHLLVHIAEETAEMPLDLFQRGYFACAFATIADDFGDCATLLQSTVEHVGECANDKPI